MIQMGFQASKESIIYFINITHMEPIGDRCIGDIVSLKILLSGNSYLLLLLQMKNTMSQDVFQGVQ